ncbi:MAG: TCR/Tet family MFS transporter [Xanthobacteraceae bacterium]|jgi:DHA1 family tetracycline resistance protein-like MFS transporter
MTETALAPPRQAAFVFILVTVLLDMLALGMIVPILPRLVIDFVDGNHALAADVYGWFGSVWALMQFLFSPVQGSLSDRFGRRPVILASNIGLGLDYILMALAPSLVWLFVGRVISGMTAASFSVANAYIADVTPPELRAARYGMIGAAFGAGFIIGPALGGLLGSDDPRLPFWVAAGFSLVNAAYGVFVLPESLPLSKRAPFSWRRANPLGSLTLLRSHRELFGLASASFLNSLAHAALPSVTVLYMTFRYGWDARMIGFSMTFIGACALVVQGGLIGRFVAHFGDRAALITGLAFGVAGFAAFGLAWTGTLFWIGIPILALWGLGGAAIQALMTKRVSAHEQGQLQGANASLMGIANMIGPIFFTVTYARAITSSFGPWLSGAPFLLAAAFLTAAMIIGARVTESR